MEGGGNRRVGPRRGVVTPATVSDTPKKLVSAVGHVRLSMPETPGRSQRLGNYFFEQITEQVKLSTKHGE